MSARKAVVGLLGLAAMGTGYERYKTGKWLLPWQWFTKTATPVPGPAPGMPAVVVPPSNPNPPAQPQPPAPAPPALSAPVTFPVAPVDTGDTSSGTSSLTVADTTAAMGGDPGSAADALSAMDDASGMDGVLTSAADAISALAGL